VFLCEGSPVRVLYSFPDELGRPGIGTTAFNQVREVARRGVDLLVYCTSLKGDLPGNVRVVQTLSVAGVRIPHRILGIDRSYRYHDLRVAAALRRLGNAVDVVHCWPRATVHTCRAARAHAIPCLREVPNTHTAHAFEVVAREVERLGMPPIHGHSHTFSEKTLALEEQEYKLATALLVPSEYSLRTFSEQGVPAEKLVLHRYGYDRARFHASPNGAGRSTERPFTAIFVGRCEPRKGLHYALQAWLDSGAAETGRFVICGSFEPGYREVLEPMLAHPSVELRGFVSDPSTLMRESDVFIFPSIEEGSALVTYEARACGCVLLVSDAAGAVCQDGVDGLAHRPGDLPTLTRQLRELQRDPTLLARLRAKSLEGVDDLSWAAAAEQLVEIYASRAASQQESG
jgi:glycosyltransferase involved in cell wall biosynthesis